MWYSTNGANFSDDFSLGYDVCAISLQNITLEAQYNDQQDNGTYLSAFDQDCVDALRELGTSIANSLVSNPSSYGPDSNLTDGALPSMCATIAARVKRSFPSERKHY